MLELWRRSASDVVALIRAGDVSAVEVTESALSRLEEVNPALNAVVAELPEEALACAEHIDVVLARGGDPGPLAGVPVTTKVNVDQAGFATTNGLQIQAELIAEIDNPVVANLRKAGAIIVGRTNTPAFSLRWFTRNSLHGHTRNPRNRALTPGGSSGGAAAAVASGICAIGHGTDIGGSIRYPAYACGIHGLRPTLGRVPAVNFTVPDRHIGAQLMAVSGPIARTIADVRLGFTAMAAEDLRDPWWVPVPMELGDRPKQAALTTSPEGLSVSPDVECALRDAGKRLENAGWTIAETQCPSFREPARLQLILWLAEYVRGGAEAVQREDDADACFVFEQLAAHSCAPDLNTLLDTLQSRAKLVRDWQQFFSNYDVLICPVSGELPFPDQQDVESPAAFHRIFEAQLTQIGLPLTGLPGLVVSTGLVGKSPVGVQLVAGRYREDLLLRAGEEIERGGTPSSPVDPAQPWQSDVWDGD